MNYKPKYFVIQELVDPTVYNERGEKAFELLDDRGLMMLDALRERYGPVTVNNWHTGGGREWSGLRTERSPYGTRYSQHRFGRAFDCLFYRYDVRDVRQDIMADYSKFPYITSIELGTSWLHFDVRNCNKLKTYRVK